mmetsp:Transcript_9800/g.23378  ORF Transcript_9800/g.23378 Transcript_9800/m.23378 type:complete len:225 (+) Transcript_9800:891-1565(+)
MPVTPPSMSVSWNGSWRRLVNVLRLRDGTSRSYTCSVSMSNVGLRALLMLYSSNPRGYLGTQSSLRTSSTSTATRVKSNLAPPKSPVTRAVVSSPTLSRSKKSTTLRPSAAANKPSSSASSGALVAPPSPRLPPPSTPPSLRPTATSTVMALSSTIRRSAMRLLLSKSSKYNAGSDVFHCGVNDEKYWRHLSGFSGWLPRLVLAASEFPATKPIAPARAKFVIF